MSNITDENLKLILKKIHTDSPLTDEEKKLISGLLQEILTERETAKNSRKLFLKDMRSLLNQIISYENILWKQNCISIFFNHRLSFWQDDKNDKILNNMVSILWFKKWWQESAKKATKKIILMIYFIECIENKRSYESRIKSKNWQRINIWQYELLKDTWLKDLPAFFVELDNWIERIYFEISDDSNIQDEPDEDQFLYLNLKNTIKEILDTKDIQSIDQLLKDFYDSKEIYENSLYHKMIERSLEYLCLISIQIESASTLEKKLMLLMFFINTRFHNHKYSSRINTRTQNVNNFKIEEILQWTWLEYLPDFCIKVDQNCNPKMTFEQWTFEENIRKAKEMFYKNKRRKDGNKTSSIWSEW